MDDRIMQAAVRAYEFATSDDEALPLRGIRAAVSVALQIQREEIAAAIEAEVERKRNTLGDDVDMVDSGRLIGMEDAAQIAREHRKES